MTALAPAGVAPPVPPYSLVTVAGDVVAVAGQMPIDATGAPVAGAFAEQAAQVIRNLELCLAAAGCTLSDVFKVNAYIADLANLDEFNELFRQRFPTPPPARTTVRCDLIGDHTMIELDALALRPRAAATEAAR